MGGSENLGANGGILPPSLLESASLGAALDDNSALINLQKILNNSNASDPIASELERLQKAQTATENNNNQQSKQSATSTILDTSLIFNQQSSNQTQNLTNNLLLSSNNNNKSSNDNTAKDSLTGNTTNTLLIGTNDQKSLNTVAASLNINNSQQNLLVTSSSTSAQTNSFAASATNQSSIPSFAIRTEGTISVNGNGDFDGVPTDLSDDARIYAAKGFIMNGNLELPVQRDAQGNPIRDTNGKLILVDKAVAVAAGYTTSIANGSNSKYAGLVPPPVVAQQTVFVPAYTDIKQVDLNRRIPVGTPTVTFNISQNPLNTSSDWSKKFPSPGTVNNPTVVRVIGGGLNIPANVNLSNYVITVEQGDINFNGSNCNFTNVTLVTNNGNINLANIQARDLSVFASGSINMNGGARFAGNSMLANASSSGNITFNGATASTNTADNLKVFSQGDITYNGATNTRGLFLSVKNFTFNGISTLYGSISAKGNIIFNGQATVIAVADLMPDITPPAITATLARDTAPNGITNQDLITFDPKIIGTVTDNSPIVEFRAGFNSTPSANYTSVMQGRNSDGSFSFTRSQLETINGGTLSDGVYTLHLQAKDLYSNLSEIFNVTFTLDTTTPTPNNLDLLSVDDSGVSNIDNITNKSTPEIRGNAEIGAVVQLFNNGQIIGQATANNAGVWQILTNPLTDGVYNLTATANDIAGNVSNLSTALNVTIDSALPLLILNTPVDTAPLTPGARLTGRVDGTGSPVTALSYHFDNLASAIVPFNATGAFDQSLDLTGLSNGAHTLTISANDTAGNVKTVQYSVTVVIDQTAPVITASLLHDTAPNGQTNSDTITFDPTITGTVIDASRVVEFKAAFDSTQPTNFVNVLAQRLADGSFTFTRTQLDQIYGATLPDGLHTLHLQAVDEFHNLSNIFNLSFTLDSITSEPIFNLNAISDSGVIGDFHTKFDTVTLTGIAEANSTVVLQQTGAVTTSDNNGQFTFAHVSLAIGDNSLIARSTDIAGNQNTFSTSIHRFSPPTAINLTDNTVAENSSTGTVIGQLSSTDPDAGDTYTYTLEDNANGRFRIVGNQLQVADGTLLNFESSTQHSVTVTSTDANGLSYSQVLAIAVKNVNEAPSFTSTPISKVNSASLYTYNIIAADPDAGDSLRFTTNNLPSWLTLVDNLDGTAILRGTPTDFLDNINSNIHLTVTDASGLTAIQDFTIAPTTTLVEQNNFTVSRSLPLIIPATPSILSFKIDPQFDTNSVNSIKDAMEVALVDANGNSLVHTIAGSRDAFFNWTEGESSTFGAGASYNPITRTVSLNLTGINPSTNAHLVFRLVNNDGDITTSVRITDFGFITAPDGTQAPVQTNFGAPTSQSTPPNFNLLTDVGSSIGTEYHRTSFNADTHLLYADIALRNIGSYSVNSPLIVAVNHISDPTVLVRNPDGFTPDGLPYYDFSKLVGDTKFDPNELTQQRTFVFYNPQGVQFTYDLTVLASLNAAPIIQTQPNKEVIGGHNYSYDVDATDANGDSLIYKLLVAPDGMAIDQTTGLINWNTATTNIGNQTVLVEVGDDRGGITQQQYSLSVIDAPPNRPPIFTSTPVVDAAINTSYTYQAFAKDADDDLLTYSFVNAPTGMTINGSTGKISWVPTTISFQSLPFVSVTVRVADERGGVADQSFNINVQPEPGNHAPIIVSEPVTQVYSPSSTLDGVVFGLKSQAPGSNASSQAPTKLFSFNVNGSNFKDLGVVTLNNSQIDADGLAVSEKYGLLGFALSSTGSVLISINTNTSVAKALSIPLADRDIRGAVFDLDDNLWVIDVAKSELLNLNPLDGSILKSIALKFSGQPLSLLDGADIAVDSQGQFYLTTYSSIGNGTGIYTLDITTGALTQLISDPGQYLAGITFASADNTSHLFGYEVNLTDDIFSYDPNANYARTTLFPNIISEFNAGRGDLAAIVRKPRYSYSVKAIDPDNDSLTYSLITAPTGMKIDSSTGGISWDNPVASTTPIDVTVQVEDGRSGVDIQSFKLDVSNAIPGQISGKVYLDNAQPKQNLVYYNDFEDPNRSLAEWSSPTTDVTPIGNRHFLGRYGGRYYSDSSLKQTRLSLSNLPEHDTVTISFQLYINDSWNGSTGSYAPDLWDLKVVNGPTLLHTSFGSGYPNGLPQAYPNNYDDTNTYLNLHPSGTGAAETNTLGYYLTDVWGDAVYNLSFTFDNSDSNVALDFIGNTDESINNESWGLDNVEVYVGGAGKRLANQSVYLDNNGNNQRDQNEPFTLTDDKGNYSFTVAPGTYKVAEELQSGWTQTKPTSKNYQVTLESNQVIEHLDFGNTSGVQNNVAPTFINIPPTNAMVGQKFNYRGLATDLNGDSLSYELVVKPEGMVVDAKTGFVSWQPTFEQIGTQNVVLRVSDGTGGINLQSFQIQVSPLNTPPQFTNDLRSTSYGDLKAAVGVPLQYQFTAQDAEGDSITYSLTSASTDAVIDATTGVLKWTPTAAQIGNNHFVIAATDGRGGQTTQPFDIQVFTTTSNTSPVVTSVPRNHITLGQNYLYIVTASDPDYDPLTYNLDTAPIGMTIDQQGRITWQPGATQIGSNPVNIKVSDGRGGVITQAFNIDVVSNAYRANNAPSIVSTPNLVTNLERTYAYNLAGSDSDGDLLLWSLDSSPAGMVIDPQSGALRWQPKADQIGEHTVTVRLTDAYGLYAAQEFTLHVTGVNTPSAIVSNPITRAAQNQLYTYTVIATDPEDDPLTFSLGRKPAGMTIDNGGTIQWTPQSNQIGSQQVEVFARDAQGAVTSQIYTIEVGATAINTAPSITSIPLYLAAVGSPYQYQVQATDSDAGDRLTYQLLSVPAGVTGISIDATTGLLTWANPVAGNYKIVVGAVDVGGLGAAQGFTLTARENHAPVIKSNPLLTATPGSAYAYDIIATDVDGDRLTYTLDQASRNLGMTLDTLGRLRWTPTTNNVGSHTVVLTVSDGNGGSQQQQYNLSVAADDVAPKVRLIANYDQVNLGESITFQARATDNIKVAGLQLLIDGTAVVLDSNGMATFKPTQAGTITAKAIAKDSAGNPGEATFSVVVIDTSDVSAPDVSLNLGAIANGTVTAPIKIKGTVNDDNLDYYVLLVAPIGSSDFKEIFRGTSTVNNDVLGKFDPSLLENDSYTLRLEAHDKGGNISFVEDTVNVSGELKLGNFRLSFTDLTIPVTGIPITLTRTYDSLTSGTTDDFGYGWRMEFRDTDLRTSVGKPTGEVAELGGQNPFKDGTKVYITLPGGKREGFTFKPKLDPLSQYLRGAGSVDSDPNLYHPSFVADAGVTDTLTVQDTRIIHGAGTNQYYGLAGSAYNPTDTYYGGVYILTTKEGIVYQIDAATGDLLTVTDTNGNTLTYTDADITSSTGQKITFGRDAQGRIATVTDPAGKQIRYEYDAKGDLIAETDREGNTTKFVYDSTQPHYLAQVIDPLGRTGVKNEYGDDGRLKKMVDAAGASVQLAYDPSHSTETITDALGHPTTYEYDERGNVVTEIDALGGIKKRTYDENNNLLTQTDPNGNTTNYSYDDAGNLIIAIDPLGNTIHYTYNKFGEVLTRTNPLGNTTNYIFSSSGNRLSLTNAEGNVDKYIYDADGRPIAIINPDGSATQFQYDTLGNLVSKVDALGHKTTYTYDVNSNKLNETTTVTMSSGIHSLTTQWAYDANNHVTSMTDPDGNVTRIEYDANGNQIAVVDPLGRRTEYIYDVKGKLIQTKYADGTTTSSVYDANGQEIATTDSLGNTTNFIYDALGRLVETLHPDASPNDLTDNPRTRTEYDKASRVTAQIDERGNRTEYTYDADGHQTIVQDALDNKTTYTYDAVGHRLTETDSNGHITKYTYDAIGRIISTHFADGTSSSTTFDALGRRIASSDQAGRTTQYEYDALNHVIATVDPLGYSTTQSYDEAGHLISQTDANNHTITYQYDDLGRRIIIQDALGNQTRYTYDASGNQVSVTDANGYTTQVVYDSMDRPVEVDFADGSYTKTIYNALGQKISSTDQMGVAIHYEYDAQHRLTAVINAMNQRTTYSYDLSGNLISQTDANSHTTNFEYDALNHRTATVLALGQRSTTTYDVVGNIVSTTDANGHTINYKYDTVNHRTQELFSDGNSVTYTYTLTGKVSSTTDERGLTTYIYDNDDRLLSCTEPDGQKIQYTYDSVGNRTSVIISAGTTKYTYDAVNRLSTVTAPNQGVTHYTYNAVGNLVKTELPNSTVEVRTYDSLNRLISLENRNKAGLISSYHYTLNAIGDRTAINENGERYVQYSYNNLYQLTQEAITDPVAGNRTINYVYDAVGNRLSQNDSVNGLTTYSYDNNDQLLSETLNGQTTSYTYDANGNTLSKVKNTTEQTVYNWNDRNRLINADVTDITGTHYTEYYYNSEGNRVAEIVDGQETRYLIDSNRLYAEVLEEYTPGSNVQAFYVYGQNLISQNQASVESFYEKDGLGSTTALTNANGDVTDTYTYDAFGNLIGSTGSTTNNYRYTTEQYDPSTGNYYLRERYYDTSIGRFTRSDFFEGFQEDPVSLHKYFYASGNPVNGTDPSGLFDLGDTTLMVALIGALAAVTYTAYKLSTTHQNIGIVPDYLKGKGNEAVDRLASATLGIDQIQGLEIMRTRIENCNSREPQEECDFGVFPVIVWGNDLTEIRDHTQEALSNLYPSFLRRINPPWSRDKTQEDENELVRLYGQNSSQLESNGFRPPLSWYNVPTTSPSYWNPFVSQPLLINKQCDEYPYASTLQGGRENYYRGGVDLALVSATQNTTQGIWLNNFYRANRITGTSLFLTSDWFGVSTTNRDRSYWYQEGEPTRHYF